jgi:hypothetical protein
VAFGWLGGIGDGPWADVGNGDIISHFESDTRPWESSPHAQFAGSDQRCREGLLANPSEQATVDALPALHIRTTTARGARTGREVGPVPRAWEPPLPLEIERGCEGGWSTSGGRGVQNAVGRLRRREASGCSGTYSMESWTLFEGSDSAGGRRPILRVGGAGLQVALPRRQGWEAGVPNRGGGDA